MSVRLEPWESDKGRGNELANPGEHSGISPSFPDTKPTTASLAPQNLNTPLQEICQQTEKSQQSHQWLLPTEHAGTMPGGAQEETHVHRRESWARGGEMTHPAQAGIRFYFGSVLAWDLGFFMFVLFLPTLPHLCLDL